MTFRISKTHTRIYSQENYKYTYFLCDSDFKNNIKRKDSNTRYQFETTPTFLLVDIARCFFPRHGTTRVRM